MVSIGFTSSPQLSRAVLWRTAAVAAVGTLLGVLALVPALSSEQPSTPGPVALGVLVLLTAAPRILAGVLGARSFRHRYGSWSRTEALPPVLVGVAGGWLAYTVLSTAAMLAVGEPVPVLRIVLEAARWTAEAALGAYLVAPGPAAEPDSRRRRGWRPGRAIGRRVDRPDPASWSADRGAASLEYAGVMFVVVGLVAAVAGGATPAGQAIAAKICQALGGNCASPTRTAEDRAKSLGVKCVIARREGELGINVVVEGVRGERTESGSVTEFGDGSGQVVINQSGGVGLEASHGLSPVAGGEVKAVVAGDVGLLYKVPPEFGGADRARALYDEQRSGLANGVHLLLPVGARALEDAGGRVINDGLDVAEDGLRDLVGQPLSPGERAARTRDRQVTTADAIQIEVSVQAEASASVGDGVKRKVPQPDGKTKDERVNAPVAAKGALKGTVKGTVTIPYGTGQPDSVPASFSAEVSAAADGELGIPFLINEHGGVGGKVKYNVIFDAQGQPTRLTISKEVSSRSGEGVKARVGSQKGGLKDRTAEITDTTSILDLDPTTPEGRANREAFDRVFAVTGVSTGGFNAAIAVPRALTGAVTDPVQSVEDAAALGKRFDQDGIVVRTTTDEHEDAGDVDVKAVSTGGGFKFGAKDQKLTSATVRDNRNGGAEVQLASCTGR
jgi:hypothetical protein